MELEDEVQKLSEQKNLHHRIHHHAKIKAGYDFQSFTDLIFMESLHININIYINLHIWTNRTLNHLTLCAINLKSYLQCPVYL